MARAIGAALGAFVLAFGARAAADAEPVRFAWVRGQGAERCAAQERVAGRVTARLGASPFSADAPRSIEAAVTRTESGFRAVLFVRRGDVLVGSREIASEGEDCASIEAASVLAIALVIDPEHVDHSKAVPPPVAVPPPAREEPRPPPSPLVPPPRPPSPLPPHKTPPRPQTPPWRTSVAVHAGVGLGLLPRAAGGLGLAGHVAVAPRVEVGAEALWLPEVRTDDPQLGGGAFGFGLTAMAASVCVSALSNRDLDLGVCGAFWAGALHADTFALPPANPGDYLWVAGSVTPRARLHLVGRLHAEAGVHAMVPNRRPLLVRGWTDPLFEQGAVTAYPFVGLGAHFP